MDVDARALEIETVRNARREEVLVIGRVAEQEHAERLGEFGVREQVVDHVPVHTAARVDPDGPVELLRHVHGVL